jgi:tRNA (guanine-N7-)-methyltransferase
MTHPVDTPHPRSIRSFVKRSGRVTTGQLKARQEIGAQFLIEFSPQTLNTETIFAEQPDHSPLVFEIGFGMGEATAAIAQTLPSTHFLCCEVHDPGVGALLKRIDEHKISNIKIIQHDAVEVLAHMIADQSLDGIHVFFPDPWHKKKHNKRRLIQSEFIKNVLPKLKTGGYIHCATDWQAYAEQMLEVLCQEPGLINTSAHASGYADKPSYRPLTKFENRGLKLGHGVWDLVFKKK